MMILAALSLWITLSVMMIIAGIVLIIGAIRLVVLMTGQTILTMLPEEISV